MRQVEFAKVESLRNDFIVVTATGRRSSWSSARAAAICDRRIGPGADGVILLGAETRQGVPFRLFNADGSQAEWSGNGVRGAAALLVTGNPRRRHWCFLTGAGPVPVSVRRMGGLIVEASFRRPIPAVVEKETVPSARERQIKRRLVVEAGNPHWVFPVSGFDFPWEEFGVRCQTAREARPTRGVNVEFVRVLSRGRIELRIFERGVGPTPASGSGALAAFAACRHLGVIHRDATVMSPGGVQGAATRDDREVSLAANARVVCTGVWYE
ncbi:MAG: diaminopimelate epimerase [Candidatus Zixiibacteriota bacterium]